MVLDVLDVIHFQPLRCYSVMHYVHPKLNIDHFSINCFTFSINYLFFNAQVYFLEEDILEEVVVSFRCPLFELWASCGLDGYTQLLEFPCALVSVCTILEICE